MDEINRKKLEEVNGIQLEYICNQQLDTKEMNANCNITKTLSNIINDEIDMDLRKQKAISDDEYRKKELEFKKNSLELDKARFEQESTFRAESIELDKIKVKNDLTIRAKSLELEELKFNKELDFKYAQEKNKLEIEKAKIDLNIQNSKNEELKIKSLDLQNKRSRRNEIISNVIKGGVAVIGIGLGFAAYADCSNYARVENHIPTKDMANMSKDGIQLVKKLIGWIVK